MEVSVDFLVQKMYTIIGELYVHNRLLEESLANTDTQTSEDTTATPSAALLDNEGTPLAKADCGP